MGVSPVFLSACAAKVQECSKLVKAYRRSRQRQHDVGSKAEAPTEAGVPAFERWQRRAFDARQREPAVHGGSDRDVAHREARARDELVLRQMAVEDRARAVRSSIGGLRRPLKSSRIQPCVLHAPA